MSKQRERWTAKRRIASDASIANRAEIGIPASAADAYAAHRRNASRAFVTLWGWSKWRLNVAAGDDQLSAVIGSRLAVVLEDEVDCGGRLVAGAGAHRLAKQSYRAIPNPRTADRASIRPSPNSSS